MIFHDLTERLGGKKVEGKHSSLIEWTRENFILTFDQNFSGRSMEFEAFFKVGSSHIHDVDLHMKIMSSREEFFHQIFITEKCFPACRETTRSKDGKEFEDAEWAGSDTQELSPKWEMRLEFPPKRAFLTCSPRDASETRSSPWKNVRKHQRVPRNWAIFRGG